MISPFLHKILDKDTQLRYRQQAKSYYSKLVPITATAHLLFAIGIEVLQRTKSIHPPWVHNATSAVNWVSVLLLILLSVLVRKFYYSCLFVGPLLTLVSCYYFITVDYDA